MIDLKYSLVIEATADPTFFGFYSPDLDGMEEHVALLKERGLPVPPVNPNPTVTIKNERPIGQVV